MTTTAGWKERFLTFKCWFLWKCPVPSQQRTAVCHCFPTGDPEMGTEWNKDPVVFLQGHETPDLIYNWLKNQKLCISSSPPTCTKYSAFERDGLLLRMQLARHSLQLAMNVWGFVPTFYKTETQILHKLYPLYHTFPCMQTEMKVAFIWETHWPQNSVSQLTVPLILELHKHFSSLWFSQNSSSSFIFFRARIWKKPDTQSQLLKHIHVGSTASDTELGWEIICFLKSEISPQLQYARIWSI